MIVYRVAKAQYTNDLTGRGAEKYGGRWNSKGVALLYTSSSRALAVLEVAVHMPLGIVPGDYQLITIEIPDKAITDIITEKDLSPNWASYPPLHGTQQIGDRFAATGRALALEVPSVVVPGDHNLLINPHHADFKKVRIKNIEPFNFDKRLFDR